jgi:alkylation response protein AidB-like acyl-CoA dehydrogenase
VSSVLEAAHAVWLAGTEDDSAYVAADIRSYQAQQVAIDLVMQATTLLFEVGGSSATAEGLRLDRHWRNARTLASHNPAIQRERALGEYVLSGTSPRAAWAERFKKHQEEARAREGRTEAESEARLPEPAA